MDKHNSSSPVAEIVVGSPIPQTRGIGVEFDARIDFEDLLAEEETFEAEVEALDIPDAVLAEIEASFDEEEI